MEIRRPPLHRLEVRRAGGLGSVLEATAKRQDPPQGVSKAARSVKPLVLNPLQTLSELYRIRAAALAEQAKYTSAPFHKERFERMARGYERLAEKYASRTRVYEKKGQSGRDCRRP